MTDLRLDNNNLTGSLDFAHLSQGIANLYLGRNLFTGSIEFDNLPHSLRILSVRHNQLTGSFIAKSLSPNLTKLYAERNQFNAVAVVGSQIKATIILNESGVKEIVDEDGNDNFSGVTL